MNTTNQNIYRFSLRLFVFGCCFLLTIIALIIFNTISLDASKTPQKSIFTQSSHPLVIAGSSHAAAFSIHNRSHLVEEITGRHLTTINPPGGDIKNIYHLTKLALNNDSTIESFVYLVDPFMLSNNHFGALYDIFDEAPFDLNFLSQLIKEGIHYLTIKNYILASFHLNNLLKRLKPSPKNLTNTKNNTEVKKRRIREHYTKERRLRFLHPNGNNLNNKIIKEQEAYFKKTMHLLIKKNINIIIIIPPTLLGTDINYLNTISFLERLKDELKVPFYDFSDIMQEQKYFVDHDHLSREGISYFTRTHLKSILQKK